MNSAVLVCALCATTAVAACGTDDFENEPRPPVAIQLTGVIAADEVTVSPDRFGAGPAVLTISNQAPDAQTVTLSGPALRERVGPINPQGTATIQATLRPGRYTVSVGSTAESRSRRRAARLAVGRERMSASGELLLP